MNRSTRPLAAARLLRMAPLVAWLSAADRNPLHPTLNPETTR